MITVVAGVIRKGSQLLLCSRPVDKPPAGWEFPGGKVEPGETFQQALERELREELALEGRAGAELYTVSAGKVELHFLEFFPVPGAVPVPCEHQQCFYAELTPQAPPLLLSADLDFWHFLTQKYL